MVHHKVFGNGKPFVRRVIGLSGKKNLRKTGNSRRRGARFTWSSTSVQKRQDYGPDRPTKEGNSVRPKEAKGKKPLRWIDGSWMDGAAAYTHARTHGCGSRRHCFAINQPSLFLSDFCLPNCQYEVQPKLEMIEQQSPKSFLGKQDGSPGVARASNTDH